MGHPHEAELIVELFAWEGCGVSGEVACGSDPCSYLEVFNGDRLLFHVTPWYSLFHHRCGKGCKTPPIRGVLRTHLLPGPGIYRPNKNVIQNLPLVTGKKFNRDDASPSCNFFTLRLYMLKIFQPILGLVLYIFLSSFSSSGDICSLK